MNKIFTKVRRYDERGAVDLGSVMVGIIVTAIVASVALVSIVGFVRLSDKDNTKSELKSIRQGLVSYHTSNDHYPVPVAGSDLQKTASVIKTLAEQDYLPKQYTSMAPAPLSGITKDNFRVCYVGLDAIVGGVTISYPQRYEVTIKSPMGEFYHMTDSENVIKDGVSPGCASFF